MKIIYGTGNKEKLKQVEDFFKEYNIDVELLSLKDINFNEEIIENGKTFEENSLIKAKAIKEFCNKNNINEIIITDDAGLCVDALNGKPGVYSARWAGEHATQDQILNKLLTEMKDVPEEKRTAKFVCVLTAILPDGQIVTATGETKGRIAFKYGKLEKLTYGPVFIAEEYGKLMNDLTAEQLKHTHREKAFLNLLKKIGY